MAPAMTRCNAYGAENTGGAINLGGFDSQPVVTQWPCVNPADHRFTWVCEHGHKGSIVPLCQGHYEQFTSDPLQPFTMRRDVRFCPRCNTESDHQCKVRLVAVS